MTVSVTPRREDVEPLRPLLVGVLARLSSEHQAQLHPHHDELALLVERLDHLDEHARAQLERAAVTLRGALVAIRGDVDDRRDLGKRERLLLRGVLRALAALLDNTELRASPWRLSNDQLTMAYSRADLAALALHVCQPFERLARLRKVQLSLDLPEELAAEVDERKVQLVLLNLLFNAIKYTPEEGIVRLSLEADEEDDHVVLVVEDNGPPIPRSHSEEIFDRSRQLDRSVFLRLTGDGLNLGASRDLVALHGGLLVLAPSSLGGPSFRARFPRRAPEGVRVGAGRALDAQLPERLAALAAAELAEEEALERRIPDDTRRPLVLIVEDSRSVQRVLVHTLSPDSATASAMTGVDGLRKAFDLCPDAIVTDVHMPGLDARELIRAVRRRPELAEVPILVLTDPEDASIQVELLEAGAQDVIRKPLLVTEVRARVRNLLKQKQTLDVLNTMSPRHESDPVKLAADISRHQRELQDALEQVEVARDLAERASQTKSNFLRMMSHELRTPVTAMHLHIHVMRQDPVVATSPRLTEGFARIQQSSQRLLHLVNTILEWARVESNRVTLTLEELDLLAIAHEAVATNHDLAERKRLEVVLEAPAVAMATPLMSDRRLVSLIVSNLVSRAVQSTERGSVLVRVGSTDGAHTLSVRDGMPRLSARVVEELFEPLGTSKDLRWQGGGGSGLGLFVVRDLARAVEAEIAVEPWDGAGNTLTVRFPSLPLARGTV